MNRTRQGYSLSLLLFNIVLEVQDDEIRQENEIIYADWEGRNKIVFADCMIICVKNLKKSTEKLELISNLSRLQHTRLIHTKVICFPLYHKEYLKVEIKNSTFKLPSNKLSY